MIKTPIPYATTAKTAEIMSRYRPIAPKPEGSMGDAVSSMSQRISKSPYLSKLWPQLQARPTRTRKRGRATMSLLPSPKRLRQIQTTHQFSSIPKVDSDFSSKREQSCWSGSTPTRLFTLIPPIPDLNKVVPDQIVLEEKDLLNQLNDSPRWTGVVIAPQPVRPVGSSISVGCINEDPGFIPAGRAPKKAEEVEEEVESEALPVVVSDSKNKVRLANSAYKEMVGQPECPWLETMVGKQRICGEVRLSVSSARVPVWSKGFSCWVRIEWNCRDGKKKGVDAFCDVMKLDCESKDYLFTWRFHTRPLTSQSSSNARAV